MREILGKHTKTSQKHFYEAEQKIATHDTHKEERSMRGVTRLRWSPSSLEEERTQRDRHSATDDVKMQVKNHITVQKGVFQEREWPAR